MSDILCKWLNQELRLSKAVEPKTLAKDFSTGYLIGEVLHKYQLQNDFSMFMRKDTSTSRLNNYTRLEPTLQLLGISFDKNTVQELTQEKPGIATRLLYQLYVSLEKKNRAEITGTVMEIMQPATNAGMHKREQDIYADRLHQLVKPDTELKLPKISQHYEEKYEHLNNRSVVTHPIQQKRPLKGQDEKVLEFMKSTKSEIVTVIHLEYICDLNPFNCSGQPIPGAFPISGSSGTKLILQSNSKYIQEIRQRLEENAVAREQKEQRLDRFLVEQLKAHEAQEEARREEQLVKRLTRQTKQEQRLASQLLQIRLQKEVIQQNRLFREQQYQQRRERDFHEALEREAALDQQAKLERADEIRKELEFLNTIAVERAQSRYDKHFKICKDILEQIVDLATKVGEYRLITANLIPEKRMREWKELLISGLPLYEPIKGQQPGFELPTSLNPVELKKQEKLNNLDYDEYTNMVGEWTWPEEAGETKSPPTNNSFLGHVVLRVRNIVHPPAVELTSTSFPHFTLKACVLGKLCSGKTTCLAKIAKAHGICVLSADTLVEEALNAHHNGEELHSNLCVTNQSHHNLLQLLSLIQLSTRAMQGATAEKELRNGNAIPNELLVDIIVNAIRQVPARSGWILDGFPVDITQAHLLEKALGGSVDEGNGVESSRVNLAVDPDPPKPLPPTCPVLDLALLLDVPDETVVTRTFSHTGGSLTLITAFQDTWPKLEEWFGEKQNILVRVDANVVEEELYKNLESILQQGISEYLYTHWETICDSYVNNTKTVMQQLRSQSVVISHHLFNIREEFKLYLGRPDMRQELVTQWQKDFNSISDDMRDDEDTKAELHLRLDELRERLWDISDKRKEQDEQERTSVMTNGWLEEHSVILVNHHSILTQVELDRFQGTVNILRVYYFSMERHALPEPPTDFVCIRLLCVDCAYTCVWCLMLIYFCCACVCVLVCVLSENATKVRIELVKGHGLMMMQRLQSKAEQAFGDMEKWLEAHFLSEMKSIDQLSEVVRHHIEAGAKLQKELRLECADFYLNGDCHMVASQVPPPRPPPLEKSTLCTPTIKQLESLHQQLRIIAPSGLMSSFEFSNLLRDVTSVNMGRNILPEPWMNMNERQVLYKVDCRESKLIDWRRFLLSAALPWPFPSLTQLLAVLQRFKTADTGNRGFLNREQYLKTELWFSSETVQPVPEDPTEPLPYDRLANLRKYFFRLFADHSFSPPRLDYVSMLQYFAADPNPRQGFIRALSVVLGKHLKHSSPGHLVKHLVHIFRELGCKPENRVPFSILCRHPFIQGLMETSTHYQLVVKKTEPIASFIKTESYFADSHPKLLE
uniref:Calponin-homology (CH) domain-containing protein n=1 Tax=Scophthalmus maximus TaxID=52904 RepID=A0A8D2ZVW4_SCOMX